LFSTGVALRSTSSGEGLFVQQRLLQNNSSRVLVGGCVGVGARSLYTHSSVWTQEGTSRLAQVVGGLVAGAVIYDLHENVYAEAKVDWNQIRKEIADLLHPKDSDFDDGSYGPIFVRLAWHAAGTYDKNEKKWGSNGASMRYSPESGHGANNGLGVARERLEQIKRRHPEISFADLWTLAGVVAVEELGGPTIPWQAGRTDATSGTVCPPEGKLPDASQGAPHVRDIFYRMGFNDGEIVALIGAHALGRCHTDRSGYTGPWTHAPTTFSNEFFRELVENKWTVKKWSGPLQYEDPSGELMMTPADMAFLTDPAFRKYVDLYAKDEQRFFQDFAKAFGKLLEQGVPRK